MHGPSLPTLDQTDTCASVRYNNINTQLYNAMYNTHVHLYNSAIILIVIECKMPTKSYIHV